MLSNRNCLYAPSIIVLLHFKALGPSIPWNRPVVPDSQSGPYLSLDGNTGMTAAMAASAHGPITIIKRKRCIRIRLRESFEGRPERRCKSAPTHEP